MLGHENDPALRLPQPSGKSLTHARPRQQPPRHRARPDPCDRRRHRGQSRPPAQSAQRGRRLWRRHRDGAGALSLRLPARGSGAEARVPGGLPGGLRGAGARHRRRRTGDAGRPALGRGRQALQRHGAPRWGADRGGAVQGRPAQLRRLRREARLRSRAVAGADRLSRRARRRSDLRGHLGSRPGRVHPRNGGRNSARAQRLALRARQARHSPEHRCRAGRRERAAAHLSQHGRRPGRARVRRRLVRAQRRPNPRRAIARLPRDGGAHRLGAGRRRAGAASRVRAKWSRRGTKRTMRPASWVCATMSRTTAFRVLCLASPAASIRLYARRWRSTRWARSGCMR